MLNIGCHLSSSGGYAAMVAAARSIDANTFAFFTRNPRGSKAKALDPEDCAKAASLLEEYGFARLVAHGSYTMNLCTADPAARTFAASVLKEDLQRISFLPDPYYNFHPGSHVGQGAETGIRQITQALVAALEPDHPVTVLLETMAGKGSEIGGNFAQLRSIIDGAASEKVGVCLDTCHVWDGGYDIVNNLEGVLEEFDRTVGLDRLKALHLNDSLNPLGARKDRHAKIGEGHIGLDAFERIINHPELRDKPMILETPNELDGYAAEISALRKKFKESSFDKP